MKFIISENKLKELRKKLFLAKKNHLDSYVTNSYVRKFDSFIVIEDPDADSDFDEPYMEYDSYDGRLFVNKKLRNRFTSLFGSDEEQSNLFFQKWFENRFGVKINFFA